MIVMNNLEYSKKMANLVGDGSYNKMKKDPTLKNEIKLSNPK